MGKRLMTRWEWMLLTPKSQINLLIYWSYQWLHLSTMGFYFDCTIPHYDWILNKAHFVSMKHTLGGKVLGVKLAVLKQTQINWKTCLTSKKCIFIENASRSKLRVKRYGRLKISSLPKRFVTILDSYQLRHSNEISESIRVFYLTIQSCWSKFCSILT